MYQPVCEGVIQVGGSGLSDFRDCMCYAVDLGELALIDCGAGPGWRAMRENLCEAGFFPAELHTLVLTHGHVDHVGAAAKVRKESGCRVVAHELDAPAIRTGDPVFTAASWYDMTIPGCEIDREVRGAGETLAFSRGELKLIHAPGHTPGSMVALLASGGQRVLFGQDIHGPFSPDFRSDILAWERSMRALLALEADILCEGHYGIFRGKDKVAAFIRDQLREHGRTEW